jgi:protein SCO1/2
VKRASAPLRARDAWPLLALAAVAAGVLALLGARGAPPASCAGLLDQAGAPVAPRVAASEYKLVAFGYTFCPDVCPATLTRMRQVLQALGPGNRVLPLFVTVDPARDTPAVIARYVARFDPRIVGVTGEPARLEALAGVFGVHGAAGAAPDPGVHAAGLYLLDAGNRPVATYALSDRPGAVASDVARRTAAPRG